MWLGGEFLRGQRMAGVGCGRALPGEVVCERLVREKFLVIGEVEGEIWEIWISFFFACLSRMDAPGEELAPGR